MRIRLNHVLLLLLGTMLVVACHSGRESKVQSMRENHLQHYREKLELQRDTLRMADSLLTLIVPQIQQMLDEDGFEHHQGEFDDLGIYFIKGTDVASRVGTSYLHATVNEYGITRLISEYRGGSYINHTQIRLEAEDGTSCTTLEVPVEEEGGANYHFTNQGLCHESVSFTNGTIASANRPGAMTDGTDGTALAFVDLHAGDRQMKAYLLYGEGKKYRVNLTSADIKALSKTYQLGQLLSEQRRLSQQSKAASEQILFLETKISIKESEYASDSK